MKRINLALQGGGAHGAFTWGVLDVLLQDEDIEIAGITGTSAGAMNGAALKAGMLRDGRQGARDSLRWFWEQMGAHQMPGMDLWFAAVPPGAVSRAMDYSWPFMAADMLQRMTSPYAMGPFYEHPLRDIVDQLSFDLVCAEAGPELFVCATNVRSGKARVFSGQEISTEALLASACLPTLFKAVEIADPETGKTEAYWDGGYTGNPSLWPLYKRDLPEDVVIININPLRRETLPVTPQQIGNRINEISFNASLMSELRAVAFVQRLIDQGALTREEKREVKVHMIADDDLMTRLSVATKSWPVTSVLLHLKEAGEAAAKQFLSAHKADLNVQGTVDLAAMYGV
ncbi:patatin-like phospholipase family protein [Shimia sp. R11_0]|uniref:Patatin-like phospholipase n=1 Tax=Shimia marina TaxID=321267 RepID=A0A0P1FEY0_9RHOB|nr:MULTISPECIES: patatin-like phospholipase family protein [Shimia]MBO9477121.1 patatin-like phospholipase family protein [Shimia sp. R11_0]CUH53770.1 Patatin-like phospholipase [Shimia marina]SFD68914.1 NTE family protein [Shimia marina]